MSSELMSSEPVRWYPSKIDWWIGIALLMGPVWGLGTAGALAIAGHGDGVIVGLGVVVRRGDLRRAGVIRYAIDANSVLIRHGLMTVRIPLRDITEVYPTSNPLSSPALSLDRLHLQFGEGLFKATRISPKDREGFLSELASKPGLDREGDMLRRRR